MTKDQFDLYTKVHKKKGYSKACCRCGEMHYYLHKSPEFPKPTACPICGEEWWDKPLDEAKCFNAQKVYLADRTNDNFYKLYNEVYPYAVRTAQGMLRSKKIIPDLHEKAHDGTMIFLSNFLTNENHKVELSFGSFLERVLRGPLFKDALHDQVLSLDWKKPDGDSNLGQYLGTDDDEPAMSTPTNQIYYDEQLEGTATENGVVQDILKIIDVFCDDLRGTDPAGALLLRAGIYTFFLQKSRSSMDVFYDLAGEEITELLDRFALYLRDYLYQTGNLISE